MEMFTRFMHLEPEAFYMTVFICLAGSYFMRNSIHSHIGGLIFYPAILSFTVLVMSYADAHLLMSWQNDMMYFPMIASLGMCVGYIFLLPVMRVINRMY